MDGNPNFENYTFEELNEAKNGINREKYPENYEKIISLLSNPEFVAKTKEIEVETKKELKYSTFWPRVLASIIDGLLFILVIYIESLLLGFEYSADDKFLQSVNAVQFSIYAIIMHGIYGQTVGKMLVGVKVLNHENEQPIKMFQSLRRESVTLIISVAWVVLSIVASVVLSQNGADINSLVTALIIFATLSFIWSISEFVTMLFNSKRRAVHDFIGKTVVVRI
jgi:uncharacterized RDD family membrane protein YckC